MPRRTILSPRQRSVLFDLPTDKDALAYHYTLSDEDLVHIDQRRRAHNKLGFALQLCALRYPGRLLVPGEVIPSEVLKYIAPQICVEWDQVGGYAVREETRRDHMLELRDLYGFTVFAGRGATELKTWLLDKALTAQTNFELAQLFVSQCRATRTILPATSTIERLCADTLVEAEKQTEMTVAARVDTDLRVQLDGLLDDMKRSQLSRFAWLRQIEVGVNSRYATDLLDRLEWLQKLAAPKAILDGIAPHQVKRLRRHGEHYTAYQLRELTAERRYAIMATCLIEWEAVVADTIIETHERIVNKTFGDAKREAIKSAENARANTHDTLRKFMVSGALPPSTGMPHNMRLNVGV